MPTETLQSIVIEPKDFQTVIREDSGTKVIVQGPVKQSTFLSYIPFINYDNHHLTCNLNNENAFDRFIYHFSFKKWAREQLINWNYVNSQAAYYITEFKSKYILSIGALPVRSVCMAITAALGYTALAFTKPTFGGKLRNGLISIILSGIFWTPELFNPLFDPEKAALRDTIV